MKRQKCLLAGGLIALAAASVCAPWAHAAGPAKTPAPATKPALTAAQTDIPGVIARVSPSVVAIVGKPDGRGAARDNRFNLAHGTGLVVKADGWILTNAHVVKEMDSLTVITVDGRQFAGTVTNMDEESDLALVKIAATGLSPATFAPNYSIKVGETVVAIGTPISVSLRNSASAGIISGVDRSVNSTYRLIQTDASINPGNSGGPLVNLKGEVVGINSLKFVSVGIDNLSFAIPADTAQYVMSHFFTYGKVNRPYLGAELEESWAAVVGLPTKEPLRVVRVDPGSPAEKAGFQTGDVIYSVNQVPFTTVVEFNELLKRYLPGQTVEIVAQSGGDLIKRKVTFATKP
ncbi:trypsin-like peptidase domain-containing protein [Brevibacillus brevis]|uniref:Trypsin-like peptidase domain-containing protein n=1 Tax=Brevibacillus brevis TaxID=1393 RepID=A0ABY9T6F9_BREBE|nr:trypsin-like peptidase domain-containing protein [Brevibacillus brevis]WNC13993.1 trypsin-like peptidase domain-containing protein [Brevibacillus brevis]